MQDFSTVGELKDVLDGFDDNSPLRVALQPSYPMGGSLLAVNELDGTVWLATSGNEDYEATRELWEG